VAQYLVTDSVRSQDKLDILVSTSENTNKVTTTCVATMAQLLQQPAGL